MKVILMGLTGSQAAVVKERYTKRLKIKIVDPDADPCTLRNLSRTQPVLVRVDRVSHKHVDILHDYIRVNTPAEMYAQLDRLAALETND